jgi:Ca-activated chloride channel family protein
MAVFRCAAAVTLASVALTGSSGQSQSQPGTEIRVEVIRVPVSVFDGRNNFVKGLKQTDFDVLEDGVAQEITSFALTDSPVAAELLIDTSGSMTSRLDEAKRAAVQFVRLMRSNDVTKVVQFDQRVTALGEFSSDKAELEAAIGKVKIGGATALYNALRTALADLDARRKTGQTEHRAIVVLSDGEDTASAVKPEEVAARAKEADAMIYTLSLDRVNGRPATDTPSAMFLRQLADQTGGELSFPEMSDLQKIYRRLAEELRQQYVLGYVSSNAAATKRFRAIVVRVKNRANLRLRHRLGYSGADGRTTR